MAAAEMLGETLRFIGIGGLATLVHATAAMLAAALLPVSQLEANLIGFLSAVMVSYTGHARITFNVAARHALHLPRFVLTATLSLAVSSTIVWLISGRMGAPFALSMALMAVVVPLCNFFVLKFWVFAERPGRAALDPMSLIIPAGVALIFLSVYWNHMLHHDVAWYFVATRDWLNGATLYRDIIEVNPPLNFYLSIPTVLIAEISGLSPENSTYLGFAILLAVSLHWSHRILRAELGLGQLRAALMVAGIGYAALVPPVFEQIQRDQLVILFMMPWLLSQFRADGREPSLAATLFFALGMCLKPYFVLFPIFVTLWQIATRRSLRPVLSRSNLVLAGAGLAYIGFVALVHPLYFQQVMAVATEVYGAIHLSERGFKMRLIVSTGPAVILFFFLLLRWRALPRGTGLLFATTCAGVASYMVQQRGFAYHAFPTQILTLVTAFWVLVNARSVRPAEVVSVGAIALAAFFSFKLGPHRSPAIEELASLTRPLPARSIWAISSDLAPGPGAALWLRKDWVGRYPHNWLAPGVDEGLAATDCTAEPARCARLTEIGAMNAGHYVDDLIAGRPDMAVIDKDRIFLRNPDFNWYDFLGQDPRFATALAGYHLAAQSERYDVYLRNQP